MDNKQSFSEFLREDPGRMEKLEELICDVRKNMEHGGYSRPYKNIHKE